MNKNNVEYAIFITFAKFIQLLGIYRARKLARLLGVFFYYCVPVRKKLVAQNLTRAFPEKSASEINTLVKKNYISVTIMLFETMCIPKLSDKELKDNHSCDKWDLIEEKRKLGKGLILITAHFGNWEFGAVSVGSHVPNSVDVLVKSQRNELVSEWLDSMRKSFGNRVIKLGSSVRELLKVLHSGGAIGIVGDQRGHMDALRVKFFGIDTAVHSGTAIMALKNKSPIIMVLTVRQPDGSYYLHVEEINYQEYKGEEEEKILQISQSYMGILEKYIRKNPDHWFWMHNIWKY